jgi:branched-chain amino acid transport system substrate-binding protein
MRAIARRYVLRSGTAVACALAALFVLPIAASAEVKIGEIGPFSGDAAASGSEQRAGIDLAVKEKNTGGGVLGQQIRIIFGDDGGKPEQAVSVAKRLTTGDDVLILLGSTSSPASLAISQVAAETETPQIVVGGTAQKITTQGNTWVFRSAMPDVKLAGDLVDFVHERFPDKTKIGFIYVNDDFGKGGLDSFKLRAAQYPISIVAEEKYTRGDLDFTSQLSRIKSAGAQILVDWSRYAEAALIAKQYKQMGLDIPRFGCDGQATPKFRELAGDAANGMYYATHFTVATSAALPAAQSFIKKFRDAYGKDPDTTNAEGYDAATAAILAIEKAGKADRTAVRDALRHIEFDGVRGHFVFDQKGDPTFSAHIVLIKDDQETNARAATN